jgi:DNA mismatch repair protein MutS
VDAPTPMLKQYHALKSKYPHCILFFRLGDFYEMFYEDAKIASRVLDVVLTGRGKDTNKVPMCGFPYHAAETYVPKLINAGYKVAICEQLEDPALAKGIVKRDVIRIITSGTYLDEHSDDSRYILCVNPNDTTTGLALIDPTTGTIATNEIKNDSANLGELFSRLPICECIFPESSQDKMKLFFDQPSLRQKNITVSPHSDWSFNPDIARKTICDHFHVHNLHGFGIEHLDLAVSSTGALLEYLKQMNQKPLSHIDKISLYTESDFVFISPAAHRGLELSSLIKTLDHTLTALGKRAFQSWFLHPLKNIEEIQKRQQAVSLLKDSPKISQDLKLFLDRIPDLEKNISRLSCGYSHVKDLLAIRNTLECLPALQHCLVPLAEKNDLFRIKDIPDLREYLLKVINEDVPLSNSEGKAIKPGYHAELDSLRNIQENGREWLKTLQEKEIKRSGINSLKIGFNRVFGYYIEITNSNLKNVPTDFIRKQTLVNGERYITPELKEYEEKILTAQEKIIKIENTIIAEAQTKILDHSKALHAFCNAIAVIDALYSLSVLAQSPGYVLPELNYETCIDIKDGRHPVVEQSIIEPFVANDTLLDCDENHLIILTGPNMAGKSTYIRQTAILVMMAQVGSFIPAQSATIGIVDKIFTRIGAHDDISKGQSTFMVEMNETADILNNLSERSLVILDEIGRGTSTYDGLSLAWALAEHFQKIKVRCLFATHFHELIALAQESNGVKNYNVAVKEWKDEIIFLHKIVPGSTDDSYGIYVAKLAGIPEKIIARAKHILTSLEVKNNLKENLKGNTSTEEQLNLFSSSSVLSDDIKAVLKEIDVNKLTPLEALNKLQSLKEMMDQHDQS